MQEEKISMLHFDIMERPPVAAYLFARRNNNGGTDDGKWIQGQVLNGHVLFINNRTRGYNGFLLTVMRDMGISKVVYKEGFAYCEASGETELETRRFQIYTDYGLRDPKCLSDVEIEPTIAGDPWLNKPRFEIYPNDGALLATRRFRNDDIFDQFLLCFKMPVELKRWSY